MFFMFVYPHGHVEEQYCFIEHGHHVKIKLLFNNINTILILILLKSHFLLSENFISCDQEFMLSN